MWYLGICSIFVVRFCLWFILLVGVFWKGNINSLNWVVDLIVFM